MELPQKLVGLLPTNPLGSMVQADMLQIVIFALVVGVAFALFLNLLRPRPDDYTIDDLADAVRKTITSLNGWTEEAGARAPSRYNFALTDGRSVIASRYVDDPAAPPHTLYYAVGERFEIVDGRYRMRPAVGHPRAVIVASEPLTGTRADWIQVPPNHMVLVTPEFHVGLQAIP